ncbi:MAG: threonine-phosphate decarboxylase [Rhodobacteraceae bacterium]|uniref:threonine-phosphate decarboxylase CobD n=1 Tax=Accumulibacter sp. TaxID=2053492 RepID=UPI0019D9B47B|nr:threonine-phosphate decarboxylase CobD [Accumulibacter sp.]MBE2259134.1 threonine-phosphate decarboxylase [Paracoccaceae bacterium]
MLEHGGRLRAACRQYAAFGERALSDWIDLSTGINPCSYPVPAIDPACWRRLPEDDDGLEAAAAAYYGSERLLAVPGSQAAIQWLPALFGPLAVACMTPIYEEHPQAWQRAGHKLRRLENASLARALAVATPVIVLCNPNNPTGTTMPAGALLDAAGQLQRRGGWLVVDEAFGDAAPENCVSALAGGRQAPNLIVLRSLGKFFGLAGARVGFVFGADDKLARLREAIGPWPLSGPARAVARQALSDTAWHQRSRRQLLAASARLAALLAPLASPASSAPVSSLTGASLFVTVATAHSQAIFEHLAHNAILTRHFPEHALLRFGLPGSDSEWQRLTDAIATWAH